MLKKNGKKGQALVEYGLIIALLAITVLYTISALGSAIENGLLENIRVNLEAAKTNVSGR
ncbi:MAG: Flp family type IVb pilin [Candidatus Riflebacteria bacterium]|nr:Flp family type IVb pilin [Candidatus Riflebacteria bacterium]